MINFDQGKKELWQSAGYFVAVVIGAFAVTFSVLYIFGWVPASFKPASDLPIISVEDAVLTNISGNFSDQNQALTQTRPDRVVIPKIGVDSDIGQPNTQDVAILDQYLMQGAVHYPGSGTIEAGNIFIFGHSTGYRVVQNQAYKTFNNLEDLKRGDEIILEADGREYIYEVQGVKLVDENQALVSFEASNQMLTITTCNTFGAKSERWVVEAILKS